MPNLKVVRSVQRILIIFNRRYKYGMTCTTSKHLGNGGNTIALVYFIKKKSTNRPFKIILLVKH